MKPKSYLSSTTPASTKKMPNSKELEPLGQSRSTLSTLAQSKPKISTQQDSGTLAQPTLRMKLAALVPSNSGALLLLKPSTSPHQNPGTLLPMNSKTQVPPLNPGTPSQPKAGIMKHVSPLHCKHGAPSQSKLDAPTHPNLGYSHHSHPKGCHSPGLKSPHFRSPNTHHTPNQEFLLPRAQITCRTLDLGSSYPRPLKFCHLLNLVPHLTKLPSVYHFPNLGPQSPTNPKPHYPLDLPDPGPYLLRAEAHSQAVSSPTSLSSTITTSVLREPLPTPFHPTLPSLLPPGRLWHQHNLLP